MAAPKKLVLSGTPAIAPVAPPYARRRRKRLDPAVLAANRTLAKSMIGYDDTSPIWSKTVPEVLDMIDGAIDIGNYAKAQVIVNEYRRRITQNKLAYS